MGCFPQGRVFCPQRGMGQRSLSCRSALAPARPLLAWLREGRVRLGAQGAWVRPHLGCFLHPRAGSFSEGPLWGVSLRGWESTEDLGLLGSRGSSGPAPATDTQASSTAAPAQAALLSRQLSPRGGGHSQSQRVLPSRATGSATALLQTHCPHKSTWSWSWQSSVHPRCSAARHHPLDRCTCTPADRHRLDR